MQTLIHGVNVVLPEKVLENGWLLIEDGKIAGTGEATTKPAHADKTLDGGGQFLLPGLIDLHCDGIEKLVEPRPTVMFDIPLAVMEADRRLAAVGITTEFHAIALDDSEFGTRSADFAVNLARHLMEMQSDLLIHHEMHARMETTSEKGYQLTAELIKNGQTRLVSMMDHTPGQGQYTSVELYRQYIKKTVLMSDAEIDALLAHKMAQKEFAVHRIEGIAALARTAQLALATHDDDDPAKVEASLALGVTFSEFPTTLPAARKAKEIGLGVCMGAPNVLRGKSSGGNLSATETVELGICDVLCADYYPSSMLAAAFKLAMLKTLSLPEAVKLVTLNAARAVKMEQEIGSLEVGKQADLILVAIAGNQARVQQVWVGGAQRLTIT